MYIATMLAGLEAREAGFLVYEVCVLKVRNPTYVVFRGVPFTIVGLTNLDQ